ncbi:hypothetical protein [Pectobacterium odoriferum]|uniref:hypothetical protein n=1 Tax=Pectobacterium odoriferum TaxID=78398 RepID=UPI000CD2742F|nr:hypothetical protein [Pectobacterium odoriferum]POD93003.1 hypothetical protein BV925_09485 [Pectobacterium odoriferum]
MESVNAIHEFKEVHGLKSDQFGNLHFQAFIEYRSPTRNASEITDVKIIRNGYQDGEISLIEAGELVAEYYHLDFNTRFQEYNISDEDKKLLVSGNSQKMGGEYIVSISPV